MKNVIITGANSGLGFRTSAIIAKDPQYRVILACRNKEKAEAAKQEIIDITGNTNTTFDLLDTSSLESVRHFVEKFAASGETLDVLVNNAGISPQYGGTSTDGFELVFATNYLGHFLLTKLLMPHMADNARIINISSDMHNPPGGITWPGAEALIHPDHDDRRKYSYSKLCMIYFTHKLDRILRAEGSGITVSSFNPGFMADTNFSGGSAKGREEQIREMMPERYSTLEQSSAALAELITNEEYSAAGGLYYDRSVNTVSSSELSYSEKNEEELWEASLRAVKADKD